MNTEATETNPTPKPQKSSRRTILLAVGLLLVATAVAWRFDLFPTQAAPARENALNVIAPYQFEGTWVFDDERVGLVREPFVVGIPEMIDVLVKDIPNADKGFRLLFSAKEFPGYQKKLNWLRGDRDGNYYELEDPKMEGWICPALFKYFDDAPKELYIKAEAKG